MFGNELKIILLNNPHKIIVSKQKNKSDLCKKITMTRKKDYYQIEKLEGNQAFHENINISSIEKYIEFELTNNFSQLNGWSELTEFNLMISKKGKVSLLKKSLQKPVINNCEHNRKKNYLIPEGVVVAPLVDMGVMTPEGKIINSMYDKYKQINRFIEMVDDTIKGKNFTKLSIIDFGCGKSYLTFVLYYYLNFIKKIEVQMTGLDLKEDVINKCNITARKYNYDGLNFELGDIKNHKCDTDIDMVISLHACDTATDLALFNAINWNAKMIFSVPCCQHELNSQIKSDDFAILTRYGIVQERISALFTDAIRANILEYCGYKTQLLEFVDFSHTPKNILIRAVKCNIKKSTKDKALTEVKRLQNEFNLENTLYNLIENQDK